MHNQLPTQEYHEFAKFLQELENYCQYYEINLQPASRNYPVITRTVTSQLSRTNYNTTLPRTIENTAPQLTQPAVYNNAMDLLSIYQHNPTCCKQGEYFCCGSIEYMVRNCPYPDKHLLSIRSAYPASNITLLVKSESTAISKGSCLLSPGFSEKRVSLA